jgi:anti-sigma factor RsiW
MNAHDHPDDDRWIARALGETEPDGQVIDAHLESCVPCRQRLEEFEKVAGLLQAAPRESAPVHVLTALLARQHRARAAERVFSFRRPVPAVAAALVALALFGSGFWSGRLGSGDVPVRPSTDSRSHARAPLPTPPYLAIEPAIAGADNLALTSLSAAESPLAADDSMAIRDSL